MSSSRIWVLLTSTSGHIFMTCGWRIASRFYLLLQICGHPGATAFLLKSVCTAPSPWQFLYLPWTLHWSGIFHFQVIKPLLTPEKTKQNKTLIYRQMDLPSRVGRSDVFFFLEAKMILKTQYFEKKSDIFLQKNFGKIFWLIFKNF